MRKVIGIGETVLDIIFKNGKPLDAVSGGSVFNSIVSLARSGIETVFVSEIGKDNVGDTIIDFMKANNICTDYMKRRENLKTPISMAFLDDNNDAEYSFYRSKMRNYIDIDYPEIKRDDIVLVGSFYSVNQTVRPHVSGLLDMASNRGAIIIYDVNFRKAHMADLPRVRVNIDENMGYADIVRGSRQDFDVVYDMDDPLMVYNAEVASNCKRLIYTDGPGMVTLIDGKGTEISLPTPSTDTVSTIGAGDNFNAGLAYGLIKNNVTRKQLLYGMKHDEWCTLLSYGQKFASASCKDTRNYVPMEFGEAMKRELHKTTKTLH